MCWVEHDRVPLQHRHIRAGGVIFIGAIEPRHPLRHGEVNAVHVDLIAPPRNVLAVGANEEPGEVIDRTRGAMVAGNPLRVFEFEWPRRDWYLLVRMQDMSWRVGQVDVQDDRLTCVTRLLCVFGDFMLLSETGKGECERN